MREPSRMAQGDRRRPGQAGGRTTLSSTQALSYRSSFWRVVHKPETSTFTSIMGPVVEARHPETARPGMSNCIIDGDAYFPSGPSYPHCTGLKHYCGLPRPPGRSFMYLQAPSRQHQSVDIRGRMRTRRWPGAAMAVLPVRARPGQIRRRASKVLCDGAAGRSCRGPWSSKEQTLRLDGLAVLAATKWRASAGHSAHVNRIQRLGHQDAPCRGADRHLLAGSDIVKLHLGSMTAQHQRSDRARLQRAETAGTNNPDPTAARWRRGDVGGRCSRSAAFRHMRSLRHDVLLRQERPDLTTLGARSSG